MQKVGIIGGLGPEATIDYYKRIVDFFHHKNNSLSTPEIIIYSVDISELFKFISESRFHELVDWFLEKISHLSKAGADFAVISANTPHIVFHQIAEKSPIPLISIVDVTLQSAKQSGFTRIGLLGTKFTMQSDFYSSHFIKEGITVISPSANEQTFIQDKLEQEIELGIFTDETRRELLSIIDLMQRRDNIEAVILGCTELPLILCEQHSSIPLINTTELHVNAICEEITANNSAELNAAI